MNIFDEGPEVTGYSLNDEESSDIKISAEYSVPPTVRKSLSFTFAPTR